MAKMMVVGDDDAILSLLERFLVSLGYEVITAGSGEEALERMNERPEIVILDTMMSGMNGFQVLDEIKEKAPSTEVIVVTGHDETGLGIECLERGAFEFVTKPLNLDHLKFLLEFKLERMGITS
jgi:DNA-binding response OmpR family regulator